MPGFWPTISLVLTNAPQERIPWIDILKLRPERVEFLVAYRGFRVII